MFEFLNDSGTQTVLVSYDKLIKDADKLNQVKSYSTESGNVTRAWEKLTYDQYNKFSSDYVKLQDSLSYMSYGIKLQIIFNLTVVQVD